MMNRFVLGVLLVEAVLAQTYEIAEPDFLEELESSKERVIAFLETKKEELKEKIENFKGEALSPAKKRRVYYVDPTYCLEENIYYQKNGRWEVLYPKGYCFNPLDYISYDPPPMMVFNPCIEGEREWVRDYIKGKEAMLIASGCPIKEVSKQGWDRPVYYLLPELKRRLRLRHTVSIISVDRERKAIKVEEIDVTSGGKGKVSRESRKYP